MHQLDPFVRHAKDRMRHLRQRRLVPLAVAMRTDAQFQTAIRREACLALFVAGDERNAPRGVDAGAVASLFGVHGEADADAAAIRFGRFLAFADLFQIDRRHRAAQRFRIIAGVEMPFGDVVERHLLGLDEAGKAQCGRFGPGFAGQRIECHFECEAHAGARNATIRQDRRLVGRHRIGAAAIVREIIQARQDAADLSRFQASRKRISGVGAGIDSCFAIERQQAAISVGIGREKVVMFAAIGAVDQIFAAVFEPFQRPAEFARAPR